MADESRSRSEQTDSLIERTRISHTAGARARAARRDSRQPLHQGQREARIGELRQPLRKQPPDPLAAVRSRRASRAPRDDEDRESVLEAHAASPAAAASIGCGLRGLSVR